MAETENIQCPVCGYYCLGKGGHGCIDKPSLVDSNTKEKVEYKDPKEILDGPDLNYDLHILLGYVWAEGNQNREFNSTHMSELIDFMLKKHKQ